MLNETQIIAQLQAAFPEQIGDDAAIIPINEEQSYVISKDLLIEDVHFRTQYYTPMQLAHKALHVNLSDLAAMGAKPKYVLLGIALPSHYANSINEFLTGFARQCKTRLVTLIGGDTTRANDKLLISITVIGVAENKNLKYRHTAKSNDYICLAGNAGHAHVGFTALETQQENFTVFKDACLQPTARTQEGMWLSQQPGVHAMMDTSDGLFIDLKRLCAASKVGAEIKLEQCSMSKEFLSACQQLYLPPVETFLTGGEDYGLLCTINPLQYAELAQRFSANFGYALQHIGVITSKQDIQFSKNGQLQQLTLKPFSHFGEQE